MNYKTFEVAGKLDINSKSLLKIAKQLNIPKNDLGHYMYNESDIEKISEYLASSKSTGISPVHTIDLSPVQKQIDSLNLRLKDAESDIRKKADDVVEYQLLQHRQELEELYEHITNLENKLAKMEEQFLHYETVAVTMQDQFHEKKKKGLFQHIFGL